MSYADYSEIALNEFLMIAGGEFTLFFEVFEKDGLTPMSIGGAEVYLGVCPFGQINNSISYPGEVTGDNAFKFILSQNDTKEMSGKYMFQVVLRSFSGVVYKPAQGIFIALEEIPYE